MTGYQVPEDHRWLLENFSNGGGPKQDVNTPYFPSYSKVDRPIFDLGLLFHLGVPADTFCLEERIAYDGPKRLKFLWPIGFGADLLYLGLQGRIRGQIRYMDYNDSNDPDFMNTKLAAHNVREFAQVLHDILINDESSDANRRYWDSFDWED